MTAADALDALRAAIEGLRAERDAAAEAYERAERLQRERDEAVQRAERLQRWLDKVDEAFGIRADLDLSGQVPTTALLADLAAARKAVNDHRRQLFEARELSDRRAEEIRRLVTELDAERANLAEVREELSEAALRSDPPFAWALRTPGWTLIWPSGGGGWEVLGPYTGCLGGGFSADHVLAAVRENLDQQAVARGRS